jgi:hypothetical protein
VVLLCSVVKRAAAAAAPVVAHSCSVQIACYGSRIVSCCSRNITCVTLLPLLAGSLMSWSS